MITYQVMAVSDLDPTLAARQLDAVPGDTSDWLSPGSYAVVRTVDNRLGPRIWSVHKTEALAKAAVRRNKTRDIVTP